MQEQVPLRQQQINSNPEKVKFILKISQSVYTKNCSRRCSWHAAIGAIFTNVEIGAIFPRWEFVRTTWNFLETSVRSHERQYAALCSEKVVFFNTTYDH